jgi:hypothetical protein
MGNSGIEWIDVIYNWSVIALYESAGWLGITYEEINVWIFCIIWPLTTLAMLGMIVRLWRNNRVLRKAEIA